MKTAKHQDAIRSSREERKFTNRPTKSNKQYNCLCCNRIYYTQSGLWKHYKKQPQCKLIADAELNRLTGDAFLSAASASSASPASDQPNSLYGAVLQEYRDIKKSLNDAIQLLTESTQGLNTTYIGNIQNTNNGNINITNRVNVQVFLNQHCANAINLKDFIDNMYTEVSIDDLKSLGQNKYRNHMPQFLLRLLQKYTANERPLYCTNVKKKTFYVREDNVWKENEDHLENLMENMGKAHTIALLQKYRKMYPDADKRNSARYSEYISIMDEIYASDDIELDHRAPHIMREIASSVYVYDVIEQSQSQPHAVKSF